MRHLFILFILVLVIPIHAQIVMERQAEGILVKENDQPVLFYQTAPKDHEGNFERTNYIHPLYNVDGTVLTEDFPADHLHQRGIFWAWHQIIIDGQRRGDGWALESFDQEVIDSDWESLKGGKGTISTKVHWMSDLYTKNGKSIPYIEETTKVTVHPKKKNYRQIDFTIHLSALEEPVSIGGSEDDKGYSGFSVRIQLPNDVKFTGPNGTITPKNTAVESPGYVNIAATFDGDQPGGVVMIEHPDDPGYPQSWILRTKKSMQNAKYPGKDPVTISPGIPLILKYSLVTYKDTLSSKKIKKIISTNK